MHVETEDGNGVCRIGQEVTAHQKGEEASTEQSTHVD